MKIQPTSLTNKIESNVKKKTMHKKLVYAILKSLRKNFPLISHPHE